MTSSRLRQTNSRSLSTESNETGKKKSGGWERFEPFKMSVENESWGPAQGEIQRRSTSGKKEKKEKRIEQRTQQRALKIKM